jgi:hypothetical protein
MYVTENFNLPQIKLLKPNLSLNFNLTYLKHIDLRSLRQMYVTENFNLPQIKLLKPNLS